MVSTVKKVIEAPVLEVNGEALKITKVTASGDVRATLATFQLTQEFLNGDSLADVTYHAVIHPDWAIRAVTLKCGERSIHTIVMPKEQARQTFEAAKDAGHTAVLANEAAPDEIRLELANVPAGELVQVTTEAVAWPEVEAGRGKFIVPLLNGPKYGAPAEAECHFDAGDIQARPTEVFLDMTLHVVRPEVDFGTIGQKGILKGQIDAVGQISIQFDAEPVALYHEDESGKYLTVGVPVVRAADAPEWGSVALLVDRSGSMSGLGLSTAAAVGRELADRIGGGIKEAYAYCFNVEKIWPKPSSQLTVGDTLSHLTAAGGTELGDALGKLAIELKGKVTDVVLITDGLVFHTYEDDSGCIAGNAQMLADAGIACHVILVGTAPGRWVGESIANITGGFFIEASGGHFDPEVIEEAVQKFLRGGSVLKAINYFGESEGGTWGCNNPMTLPVRGRPANVALSVDRRPDKVVVHLDTGDLEVPVVDAEEARYIWARDEVMKIVRECAKSRYPGYVRKLDEHKTEIEKLGVQHQILTPFTAFVGFDPSETFAREDVKEVIAQTGLPVGIDANGLYGVNPGGALGLAKEIIISGIMGHFAEVEDEIAEVQSRLAEAANDPLLNTVTHHMYQREDGEVTEPLVARACDPAEGREILRSMGYTIAERHTVPTKISGVTGLTGAQGTCGSVGPTGTTGAGPRTSTYYGVWKILGTSYSGGRSGTSSSNTTTAGPGFYSPYHTPTKWSVPVDPTTQVFSSQPARKLGDYMDETITNRTNWTDASKTLELTNEVELTENEMVDGVGLSKAILSGGNTDSLLPMLAPLFKKPVETPEVLNEAATILSLLLARLETGQDPDGAWLDDFSAMAITLAAQKLAEAGCPRELLFKLILHCHNRETVAPVTAKHENSEELVSKIMALVSEANVAQG